MATVRQPKFISRSFRVAILYGSSYSWLTILCFPFHSNDSSRKSSCFAQTGSGLQQCNNTQHQTAEYTGWTGGNAAAYENDTNFSAPHIWGHPAGGPLYMPSLFRVTNSSRVLLANLVDSPRFPGPSALMSAGFGVDPARWNMVLRDDSATDAVGSCKPYRHENLSRATAADLCSSTAVYDRPVLWLWQWPGGSRG